MQPHVLVQQEPTAKGAFAFCAISREGKTKAFRCVISLNLGQNVSLTTNMLVINKQVASLLDNHLIVCSEAVK